LVGAYYVFVVTDPNRNRVGGDVFEGDREADNALTPQTPLIIETPPPVDLQVTQINVPEQIRVGDEAVYSWTVTNRSDETFAGRWSDRLYVSGDAQWDLGDRSLAVVEFRGRLAPGESYTSTATVITPAVTPGAYHGIVRADVFDQVFEASGELNNVASSSRRSESAATVLTLGVPQDATLPPHGERLFAIDVPAGKTLRVTLLGDGDLAGEVRLKHGAAASPQDFDADSGGTLTSVVAATVPETSAGR
jgi:hypothetical protein